jgi:hypothetical protein
VRDVRAQCLEAAAGEQLPLQLPADVGAVRKARSDRDLAVPCHDRGDESTEARQVGGQVDVQVGDDIRVARELRGVEGQPSALLAKEHGLESPRENESRSSSEFSPRR